MNDATPVVISFPLDRRCTSGILLGREIPTDLTDLEAIPFPVTEPGSLATGTP